VVFLRGFGAPLRPPLIHLSGQKPGMPRNGPRFPPIIAGVSPRWFGAIHEAPWPGTPPRSGVWPPLGPGTPATSGVAWQSPWDADGGLRPPPPTRGPGRVRPFSLEPQTRAPNPANPSSQNTQNRTKKTKTGQRGNQTDGGMRKKKIRVKRFWVFWVCACRSLFLPPPEKCLNKHPPRVWLLRHSGRTPFPSQPL